LTSKHGDEENKPVGQLITLELVLTQGILMGPPAHKKNKIIKHPTNPKVEKYELQNLQIFLSFTASPHPQNLQLDDKTTSAFYVIS
jgi:hypothetical protein